ncbi:MAG: histidinol-phosphate transaminase [Firmicutes bacterium]|nr:histidinol-phosphate transaminase [Bacillota bacterium]
MSRRELTQIRPYEPGKPIEEVKKEYGLTDIVKLASNENPLGPSPKAASAISKALSELHLYPDGGSVDLKNALAERFNVEPNWITVGNGSDEIIKRLAETFLTPADSIVVAKPTFSEYKFAAQLMGAEIVEIPCQKGRLDLPLMAAAVSENTKLVFVCNPNNPTGTIVSKAEVERFLSEVPQDVLVVFDEAYAEYVDSEDYLSAVNYLKEYPNVVVLRTFSKIYGLASLRIGYALADPEVISLVEKAREPFNVNRLAQIGALAALADTEHVERSRRVNQEGKKQLAAGFAKLGWRPLDSQTNFMLVETFQDCRRLFQDLLKKGIIIRPADIFGLPTSIRVTVGTEEQNAAFLAAVQEIMAAKEGEAV